MSIDEQISILECEKQDYLRLYDERLASLKRLQPAADDTAQQAPAIRPGSRFHPVPSTGMPASEMVLRDRG